MNILHRKTTTLFSKFNSPQAFSPIWMVLICWTMTFIPNSTSAQGTMGRWEVCGLSGTPATVSPTGVSSGVTFSVLSRGPGITAQSATGAFNSSGWSTSSTLSISNNDYYEFTITPEPGRSISISAIRFRDQMSNTSFDVSLRYSDNNYGSSLGGWTASTSATNRSVNLSSVSSLQNRTTPVTFRLYGTDASGSSSTYRLICQGTGAGQYRGVDVDGTVTHNPYVAEFVSMSYGSSPWCQGETRDVSVTVKNVGSATWNSAEPVNIGLKWNEDVDYGASPSFIPRQPAGSVATGQTVTYTFPNVPASTLTGNNNLRFDVVRELVCWFGNNSGGCGPGNSVFVSPTINILAQPTAVTVSGGGTFCNSRTLTASGGTGGTMYFQGTDPNGISTGIPATSRVVTESGTYYFRSRSAAGCWSVAGSATVTINKDVAITTQPQNQTICEGEALNLSVTATGTPAPTYQWKKNNIDILGETNATLNIPSALNSDGGSYTVAVTNTCNSITSSGATVLVNIAPVVTVDPTNETVCEGAPVTFTVTATGTILTYQWRKGGVDINGANASSYTIPSVVSADAGSYDVVVSNTGCTPATSAAATLTVQTAPVITVDPVGTTICEGGAINLSVTSTGTPAPTYQWKKDNNDILGETNSTLSIPSAVNGDGGSYTVQVTNVCGNPTSASAVVVVNIAPVVTVDPTNETVCEGAPVTFTVTATGTNLTYQWRKGGVDINGANASSYTISNVVSGDAGSYDVVVSNTGCTPATSAAATLTVQTAPVITVDPVGTTICEGGTINLSVTATGTPTPAYQWKKDNNDILGETNSTLSIPSAVHGDGGSYTVQVTNVCGNPTSAAAVVVVNIAPVVTVDPTNETVCEGAPVTFTVTATGTNLTYQWRKGGVDINGANASSYSIPSVVSGDAGSYDVVVSNTGCTPATSAAATLTVQTAPVITVDPVGTTICEGGTINLSVTATGTPSPTYQWKKDNNDILGETNSTLSIPSSVNGDGGSYTVQVTNVCGNPTSASAVVVVNIAPVVTVDPTNETVCEGAPVTFTVTATGTNLTYQWRKGGVDINGANASSYTISNVVSGDAGSYDVVVSNTGCTPATSAAATLTVQTAPVITVDPVGTTICEGGAINLNVTATGTPSPAYQWKKDNNDILGETNSTLSIPSAVHGDGGSYTVQVTNVCGNPTSAAAVVVVNIAPVVTVDPTNETVCEGAPVTFTVTATGTNLTYQWRKGGVDINGATGTSYNIASTILANAGNYDVVVSNTGCTPATSATAVLVVNARPTAIITSSSTTICSATSTTVTGNVTATGAWTLQLSDGQTTSGSGNGSFSFTVSPVNTTTYTLVSLSDVNCSSQGGDLTGSVTITTNPLPAGVSVTPPTATICNGGAQTLNANGSTSETSSTLVNNNFSSGVTTSGSTTGNRSQIFERENSGSNINSTGTFTSPNGSGMLVALSAASATGFIATANSTANTSAEMQVSTVGYNSLNLTFNHTYAQANNGGSGIVAVSTDGVNWTNVQTYSANQGGQTNFVGANIALSNAYLNQSNLRIRFTYTATGTSSGLFTTAHAYWWAIDDVSINGTLLPLYSWTADTGPSENGLPSGAGTPSADNLEIEVTPSATTQYTLTATNPVTGCISTATSVVTVNARPTAVLSGGAVYCNGENTTTALTLNVTGSGTISGTLSDNTPFSGTAPVITVNVAPSITTAYTIATLNDENCTAIAADMSGSATVTVNDRPTAVLSGGATYCENENSTTTLTLTVTGSGTISGSLSDNTTFSGTAPTITVNVAPFESTVYTIETLQDANCNALEADLSGSATIIVNPLIPVSVVIESSDLDNEICTGTSVTFTATPGNGGNASYQWLLNGNPVGTNQNTFTTDALVDGDQVSVVLTSDVTPCATGNPATSNVITTTVHALQPVSVSIASSDLDNTICDGESVTITATPVNGGLTPSYQWLLNGNPVGSDQDTYTSTTLADGDVVSVVLTSNITPCATGNPATSNTIATTVDALQPVSITIASDVSAACSGVLISFTATPVNEGDNPAYQWYVNNIAVVDSTGTTFSSAALADGDEVTCVLTSNITPCAAGNPATSNVITVTIGEIPPTPGAITGPLDVCPHVNTGIPVTYSIDPVVGATSYTWTVPVGATIVSGQGTTSIEVLIDDNFALTNSKFRVASNNDFPCSSPNAVLEVLKNVPGIPLAISGPTNVCEYVGQPTTATYSIAPVANATSYTWTVANGNMVIVSGQGTTSIEVSYLTGFVRGNVRVTANSNCGARAPRSLNVALQTVSAPEAINGPVNVCSIMENTLIATYTVTPVANATSYIWTVPTGAIIESGQGTNSIMVSFGSGFVSGQIKVKSVSNCNTSGDRSLTVSAYNIYTPGLITGPTNVCGYMVSVNNPAGTPVAYSIKKVTNATSYVWSAPAGATIVAHPAGAGENDTIVEVVFNSNFTGGAITVRSSGFCGMSAIRSLNISFLKPSAPGVITATETGTCPDRTYTYSLASIPSGALSILWTVPSGATIVSGQGTGSISVSYPSGAVRGAVTATSVSHCANSATRSLNVNLADCNQPRIVKSDAVPVKTFKAELNVQLAPNPMVHTSRLTITGSSKNMADVRIMDQLGRERFRTRAAVNSTITVGEKLEAGAYFLEVSLDGQREVKKFIKL